MKVEFQKRSLVTISALIAFYLGIWLGEELPFFSKEVLPYFLIGSLGGLSIVTITIRTTLLPTLLCAVSTLFLFGLWIVTSHSQTLEEHPLYQFSEQKVVLTGTVCDAPDERMDHTKVHICAKQVLSPVSMPIHGSLLLSISKFQEIHYGDVLRIEGVLQLPMEDETFSYRNYLLKDGITHLMSRPTLRLLDTAQGNTLWQWTFALRTHIEQGINSIWHEPDASFLSGLLIGSRKGIPEEVMDSFQRTGLTHIIAISGYNITLLIIIVTSLLSWLPKRIQLSISIIVILLFTLLVGASSAVVRAAFMGILGLIALLFHRKSTVLITILLSGACMLLTKPLLLRYDVGYQLSFLAVLGLLYIEPLLVPLTKHLPERWGIREGFSLTISATVTTTPAILYHFGVFSLVSPLANVLAGPFLPFAMLFGFLSLCVYSWFPLLGFIFELCTSFCLQAVISIAHIGGSIPGGFLEVQRLTPIGVLVSYCCIGSALIFQHVTHNNAIAHEAPEPSIVPG